LSKIPFIHANFFKSHEILSVKEDTIFEHLTSSGTTGQKSQMFFDEWSIKSARRMVKFIFNKYGFDTPQKKTNYLLFAYEPLQNFKVGTTNTNIFLTSFTKPKEIFFALRNCGGVHEFDKFGTIRTLQEYEKQNLPVRIHGFPSFTYFALKLMRDMDIKIKLHPDSMASFGGGWKGYANEEIPKNQLYDLINERLGIKKDRLRDSYGSVEHSIPYIECKNHHLHVPIWSRLFIRDVKTLEVLEYGKEGFMNFVTPYITSVPAISVMMGDIGVLHSADECDCGAKTPFFEIKGRAGVSKNKSCAVSASELLRKKGI
jgi:phenylacetate-coenzyme A ligase PaaK-like adenylate-forming protein